MMNYSEFCLQTELPLDPILEQLYNSAEKSGELLRPPLFEWIAPLFPHLGAEVLDAAQQIAADPLALRYLNLLRLSYWEKVKKPFLPPQQGNVMRNFAPILALISFWPESEHNIRQRGFDETIYKQLAERFENVLLAHQRTFGYLATGYALFSWAVHYLTPDIFRIGSLEFEITKMPANQNVFRHRQTGDLIALGDVRQTQDAYSGIGVCCRGGEDKEVTLLKAEYEPWVNAGADILSTHIPKGTDLSPAACAEAYREALDFFARYYPERQIQGFHCQSWLMDPALAEFLPESSRIVPFQRFYQRYPVRSNGKEIFAFVHPTPFSDYAELPENTSLERALKQRYLNNDPIYVHAGFHPLNPQKIRSDVYEYACICTI